MAKEVNDKEKKVKKESTKKETTKKAVKKDAAKKENKAGFFKEFKAELKRVISSSKSKGVSAERIIALVNEIYAKGDEND